MRRLPLTLLLAALAVGTLAAAVQNPPAASQGEPAPPPQQQSEIVLTINGQPGQQPKYAVPDFVALSNDAESQAAAKEIAQVLWDDLNFEQEFYMIPRNTYAGIPAAQTPEQLPYDRWKELGADAVVIGTVQRAGDGLKIQVHLVSVGGRQAAFAREYTGSAANPRAYAHTIADEIYK